MTRRTRLALNMANRLAAVAAVPPRPWDSATKKWLALLTCPRGVSKSTAEWAAWILSSGARSEEVA